MTRRHTRNTKRSIPLVRKKSKFSVVVKQQKHEVRRYEPYHENFITYNQIKNFLAKLQNSYPGTVQIQVVGQSSQGRAIYMVIISEGSGNNPKMGTMIVAGTNGTEWLTISSALYLIEQLAKTKNLTKLMDYFIIPCCNPDVYDYSLENKGKEVNGIDLSTSFPFSLGVCDITKLDNQTFFEAIKCWKDNFKFDCPERRALVTAVLTYQTVIKLFISLQGDGTKITYPFGFTNSKALGFEALRKVAKAGQAGVKSRCFEIGSMYDLNGLYFGNMVDYIRMCQGSIKFVYSIHINKKEKNLNPCNILPYGQDVMNCVRFMARNVYMMYNKREINGCDDFFIFILCLGSFENVSFSKNIAKVPLVAIIIKEVIAEQVK